MPAVGQQLVSNNKNQRRERFYRGTPNCLRSADNTHVPLRIVKLPFLPISISGSRLSILRSLEIRCLIAGKTNARSYCVFLRNAPFTSFHGSLKIQLFLFAQLFGFCFVYLRLLLRVSRNIFFSL